MSGSDNNQFRQVATLLISMTIITSGLIYNYTVTKTEAQSIGTTIKTIPLISNLIDNLDSQITNNTTVNQPAPTNDVPLTDTIIITPTEAAEKISMILAPLEQLLSLMESIAFAYSNPEINLPNTNNSTINSSPTTIPNTPQISNEPPKTLPSKRPLDQNTVLQQLKKITGYSKWEEFRDNFRKAQQELAGTGKCMIHIQNYGCLIEW